MQIKTAADAILYSREALMFRARVYVGSVSLRGRALPEEMVRAATEDSAFIRQRLGSSPRMSCHFLRLVTPAHPHTIPRRACCRSRVGLFEKGNPRFPANPHPP